MATLKAFKEAVKVGAQIEVIDHWVEKWRGSVRTVTAVQGNGYWFEQDGEEKRCWGAYPKASQLEFDGEVAKIQIDDNRHWTLRFKPCGVCGPACSGSCAHDTARGL